MLDHYKNPRNFGKNNGKKIEATNISCGDSLNLYIIEEKGLITDIKFDGDGCAVSIASASMILEYLVGKKIEELSKITKEDILDNFGTSLTTSRQKCALLVLNAIEKYNKN